ncbi:MATE family efflux transporter [Nitratireductor aestuarii]|uniref:Multidrug-efflux transporter n=1 Tax=Nitratireductor aestuarii TaxID=1735103 RepID=A0A916RJ85_9HYPH|nr:MATE family efflux transporter [Nitratireductor aestuarii]GGA55898.1 MATE family efflux transporter [Nitratireductor aestuarii]
MSVLEAETRLQRQNPWFAEIKATLALAWPMVLTNLAQTAMTATDVMLLGRLSPEALAAGTLGHNLYFMFTICGMGLVLASSPMMARAIGGKYRMVRDVRRTVRQALWLAVAICMIMWTILWWTEDILLLVTNNPPLSKAASEYMRTLQWAMLPFFCYIVLRSFIAALERPRWALVIALTAVAFNALAAWTLIFGKFGFPQLGLYGAGLATSMSSLLLFVGLVLVVTLDRQFRRFQLFGNFWRPDWPRFKTMLRLGLPISAIMAFEVSIFNIAGMLMGRFDTATVAAHSIAISIASISFMFPMGLGQAVTVRVGRAIGRGDIVGVERAGWATLVLSILFMAFMATLMLVVPHTLIGLFLNVNAPENQAVVTTATLFLVFAAIFQIADGAQAVTAGMLRGLHDTTLPMIYAGLGYWVIGLTLSLVLGFYFDLGGAGIWTGLCVGLLVVAVLLHFRWVNRLRHLKSTRA